MRHPALKIGVSGVRGIAGSALTPQIVTSFAAAFGTWCGKGEVVVGTDTRPSREMAACAVEAGLVSVGCSPVRIGVVPVPTLQHHIRVRGAAGGICITASHNPVEWNALKFCGPGGTTVRPDQFARLLDLYHQDTFPRVGFRELGELKDDPSAADLHLQTVRSGFDVSLIRSLGAKVVVDCCNGAASRVSPRFLRSLGCTVIELHTDPDSPFPRGPEPIRQNLGDLCRAVKENGADLGFAQDADADRLAVVDEHGTPLGEECTLALVVRHLLQSRPGPVVVNLSTSRMVEDVAAEYGCRVYRTPVGEVHVVQKMFEVGAFVGGEGNGGVIVPSLNPCRDSFVAMAGILESLARENLPLSRLRERLPRYCMLKERVPATPRMIAAFLALMRRLYRGQVIDLSDGVKVSWPDRWIHVRSSQTEPILRVVAEADHPEKVRHLLDSVMEYLRPLAPPE
ncbi:MAG: phosphoglucosamine mutase [Acidobacteriota bacterium]